MHRRHLLKTAAGAAMLAAWPIGRAVARNARLRRVRPSDPAWPSPARWQALNGEVGGNLAPVRALFAPCQSDPAAAACAEVRNNLANPFFLGDQAAGTEVSGFLDAWTSAPSAYAVKAASAADVAAAVNFARSENLRLVVKGAAHSYLGGSNAPDSLLVWMRAMNKVAVRDDFIPAGCIDRLAPVHAVTAEAGATWIDLYHAVTGEAGRYVQGGGCTDVGVAGLVQGGGFGSFSKAFGTGGAGLLEAEIVTADGAVLTVNPCRHPDLFWALKGGGGGSWGVVTRLTLATHDLPDHFGPAWGKIKAGSDQAFRGLIGRFVAFYADNLFNPHWGETVYIGPDNTLEISMVSQGLDMGQARQAWAPFHGWLAASPPDLTTLAPPGVISLSARHWWDVAGNPAITPDRRPGAPAWHGWWKGDQGQVGAFLHGYDSLWLPASLLDPARQSRLANALFVASRHKQVQLHFNKALAGAPAQVIAAARATPMNAAVGEAFALAIIADGEFPAFPGMPGRTVNVERARADARAIAAASAELKRIVPRPGSYVSESNYFNADWQTAYWGDNYPRLRAIKARYDPDGLFFVHHGVGSEDWNADGFERVA